MLFFVISKFTLALASPPAPPCIFETASIFVLICSEDARETFLPVDNVFRSEPAPVVKVFEVFIVVSLLDKGFATKPAPDALTLLCISKSVFESPLIVPHATNWAELSTPDETSDVIFATLLAPLTVIPPYPPPSAV